jgi:tRNA (guanine26-N2/guanine27-N2)-dimethyltransferase
MNDFRRSRTNFDVVDLDPYGTAIPFLEGAISTIANNGLLCVTFTDMAVLCARQPHVCFYRYGSAPLGKPYCHEQALRMVLYTINTMANKHGKRVEPLISLTVDFYIRLFMRVKTAPIQCHQSLVRYSNIHQCTFCESFYLQPLGESVPHRGEKKRTKA